MDRQVEGHTLADHQGLRGDRLDHDRWPVYHLHRDALADRQPFRVGRRDGDCRGPLPDRPDRERVPRDSGGGNGLVRTGRRELEGVAVRVVEMHRQVEGRTLADHQGLRGDRLGHARWAVRVRRWCGRIAVASRKHQAGGCGEDDRTDRRMFPRRSAIGHQSLPLDSDAPPRFGANVTT